jgi:hypothetical protein
VFMLFKHPEHFFSVKEQKSHITDIDITISP